MSDVVEVLRDLLRFDTTNPPGNEGECIAYVQRLLADADVDSRILARDELSTEYIIPSVFDRRVAAAVARAVGQAAVRTGVARRVPRSSVTVIADR